MALSHFCCWQFYSCHGKPELLIKCDQICCACMCHQSPFLLFLTLSWRILTTHREPLLLNPTAMLQSYTTSPSTDGTTFYSILSLTPWVSCTWKMCWQKVNGSFPWYIPISAQKWPHCGFSLANCIPQTWTLCTQSLLEFCPKLLMDVMLYTLHVYLWLNSLTSSYASGVSDFWPLRYLFIGLQQWIHSISTDNVFGSLGNSLYKIMMILLFPFGILIALCTDRDILLQCCLQVSFFRWAGILGKQKWSLICSSLSDFQSVVQNQWMMQSKPLS
jgi:hypothetical protein